MHAVKRNANSRLNSSSVKANNNEMDFTITKKMDEGHGL
jgi:hypothetical protein